MTTSVSRAVAYWTTTALLVAECFVGEEWAYAGLIFIYTGAAASHIWVGDAAKTLVGPLIFAGLAVASWALRPQSRRLPVG